MEPVRSTFVPDPNDSRETMERLQRELATAAVFEDEVGFDPETVSVDEPERTASTIQTRFDDVEPNEGAGERAGVGESNRTGGNEHRLSDRDGRQPLVAGVDQAFLDERAVSAIVLMRGGVVVERTAAVAPLSFPYVPGLLSFREGGSIVAAFETLTAEPDLVLFDGSGRIHFREAGLATHMGVTFDLPAVGVAKKLLCGTPREDLAGRSLPAGSRVAIEADADVSAPAGTVIGYAVQTKQFDGARYVNPVYVSPGHRVSADTAATLVERCCAGYKLPEPIRRADAYADEAKGTLE